MMRSNLWEWALHNRQLGICFLIVAIAAGAFSYVRLDCGEYRNFVIMTIAIQAVWRWTSVEDPLKQVAERGKSVVTAGVQEHHAGKKLAQSERFRERA